MRDELASPQRRLALVTGPWPARRRGSRLTTMVYIAANGPTRTLFAAAGIVGGSVGGGGVAWWWGDGIYILSPPHIH